MGSTRDSDYLQDIEFDLGGSSHPDANMDGFVPPEPGELETEEEVDWHDLFSGDNIPDHQPADQEFADVAIDVVTLIDGHDPSYEGASAKTRIAAHEEESLDARFRYLGPLTKWPHLEAIFYGLMMARDTESPEPITDELTAIQYVSSDGTQFLVDDRDTQHLFVHHDPDMNHPLSARVREGDYVVWVYKQDQPKRFPSEPTGYIHNGSLFRRVTK
jgi:hypothetical protein